VGRGSEAGEARRALGSRAFVTRHPGASPHWRPALIDDRRDSVAVAPPHWRPALECVRGVRRARNVALPATRPRPRPVRQRRGGVAPPATRPLCNRGAPPLGRCPTGNAPSATTGAKAPRGRLPTGDTPRAHPVCAAPWALPHRRRALRLARCNSAAGASPHRRHAHCVTGVVRLWGIAPPVMRFPSRSVRRRWGVAHRRRTHCALGAGRTWGTAPTATRPS